MRQTVQLPQFALGRYRFLQIFCDHLSLPSAHGRPTTSSVLVQIVRVLQMKLQGMNDLVIGKRKVYIDAVDSAVGQRTPLIVPGSYPIRECQRNITLFRNTEVAV